MEIEVLRDKRTTKSTTSRVLIDGIFQCFFLEDVDRGLKQTMPLSEIRLRKIDKETCIPEGRYEIIINMSTRFKRELPLLLNVPGFEGIRIHAGNIDAETWGCLLPGTSRGTDIVYDSRVAFVALFNLIKNAISKGEKVYITFQTK